MESEKKSSTNTSTDIAANSEVLDAAIRLLSQRIEERERMQPSQTQEEFRAGLQDVIHQLLVQEVVTLTQLDPSTIERVINKLTHSRQAPSGIAFTLTESVIAGAFHECALDAADVDGEDEHGH